MFQSVTPRTIACQASLSVEFFRQEYWSGLPFPSAGDLPNPRIEHVSPALQVDSSLSESAGKPYAPPSYILCPTIITTLMSVPSIPLQSLFPFQMSEHQAHESPKAIESWPPMAKLCSPAETLAWQHTQHLANQK